MSPLQIRVYRRAGRFMPRLWSFAYPITGRGYTRSRRAALRLWCFAFTVHVRLAEDLA